MKTNNILKTQNKWIFYPKDRFTKMWNMIISLMLVYLTFILPFELAFDEETNPFFQVSEVCTSLIFFFDILFHFNLSYRNSSGQFVVSRVQIAKNYLCCWFVLDVISCFPFYLFIQMGKHSLLHTIKTTKVMKYFKIIRILRFVKYMKHFFPTKLKNQNKRKFITFKSNFERMMTHLFAVAVIAHCSACLLYFLPMWSNPDKNWVILRNLQYKHEYEKYLFSLHFMVETMITVGYGENPYQ
jgi:uncharacterized membrane protein